MIAINERLTPADLRPKIERLWSVSARCLDALNDRLPADAPAPVFTVDGQYVSQGWTEWTQGFRIGSALLQFDATDESRFLQWGRRQTVESMTPHVTHRGVHDHGFQTVSTFGALRRLMNEGRLEQDPWQRHFYELALKASSAVQAARWTSTADGSGYIYSFNGPHSLFVDTLRTLRVLALGHQLGHVLLAEGDVRVNLLGRLICHGAKTAEFNVSYGLGRDAYDVRGRTTHEAIFNVASGEYRCPSTQQGYSPFTTWTRGLAWAMLGFAEQLEWLSTRPRDELIDASGGFDVIACFLRAAQATCDFYCDQVPTCGIPYWDTGAPGLANQSDPCGRRADPLSSSEPVDSSAAAIAAQGLLRLGRYCGQSGFDAEFGRRYWQAGLTVLDSLFDEPYLADDPAHEGLLLHSIYHRPRGWDHIPQGQGIPCGEATMWGDYHAREAALYVERIADDREYYTFFGPL